jgi:hypothetical protein
MIAETPEAVGNPFQKIVQVAAGHYRQGAIQPGRAGTQDLVHSTRKKDRVCIILKPGKRTVEIEKDSVVWRQGKGSDRGIGHILH